MNYPIIVVLGHEFSRFRVPFRERSSQRHERIAASLLIREKKALRQTTRRDPLQYGILIILFVVFSYDHVLSVLLAVIHARIGNLYDVFRSFICLIVFLKTDRYRNEDVLSEK